MHLFLFLNRLKKTRMKERLIQKNLLRWLHKKPWKMLRRRMPKSRWLSNSSSSSNSRKLRPSRAAVRNKTFRKFRDPSKLLRGE